MSTEIAETARCGEPKIDGHIHPVRCVSLGACARVFSALRSLYLSPGLSLAQLLWRARRSDCGHCTVRSERDASRRSLRIAPVYVAAASVDDRERVQHGGADVADPVERRAAAVGGAGGRGRAPVARPGGVTCPGHHVRLGLLVSLVLSALVGLMQWVCWWFAMWQGLGAAWTEPRTGRQRERRQRGQGRAQARAERGRRLHLRRGASPFDQTSASMSRLTSML